MSPLTATNGNGASRGIVEWLKIIGTILALLTTFWAFVARPNVAEVARAEAAVVRSEIKQENKASEDRLDKRLAGIEAEVKDLNRYLRDHK